MRGLPVIALIALTATIRAEGTPTVSANEALKMLTEGNARFSAGKASGIHRDIARRDEVAKGQSPLAIVVTCSDSRVAPELVFDQGLGDLFVIRVAGNTIDKVAIGSIEYAIEHLGSRLVVVLGHQNCGAIKAAIAGGKPHGSLGAVLDPIKPAVRATATKPGDRVANACTQNVKNMIALLRRKSHLVAKLTHKGELKTVGMVYQLDSGKALPVSAKLK